MQQQRLDNSTTTTQQMQHNYACGTNRTTAPFTNDVIRLDRLQPPSLKNNRATTHFAKAIIRLDRLQPPSFDNAYAMTQLKCNNNNNIKSY